MLSAEASLNEALSELRGVRSETVRFAVMALPRLRAMTFEARKTLLNECSDYSLREPLQYHYKTDLKLSGWKEPLDGGQVIAMMGIGLFVHMGERVDMCGALLEMFPEIEVAVQIEPKVREALAEEERAAEHRRMTIEAPLFAAGK